MKSNLHTSSYKNNKIPELRVWAAPSLPKDFGIIETLLWENGNYFLFALHLDRLKKSATQFSCLYNEKIVMDTFSKLQKKFKSEEKYRVRLVLHPSGTLEITSTILPEPTGVPQKTIISEKRTEKTNLFLYHKTTNRALYDREYEKYREKGFFDVIFMNSGNEVTEGTITNIIIRKNGKYFTPPVSCGLLDGVYRKNLIQNGDFKIEEKVLFREDIIASEKIFLCNSVRKLTPVTLSD